MTEVTAMPMPTEAEKLLEMPKKIHNPKNFVSTKLLMITAPIKSVKYSAIIPQPPFPVPHGGAVPEQPAAPGGHSRSW